MAERRVNILAIFPRNEPYWRAGEERIRRRLPEHHLEFAYGLSPVASAAADTEILVCFFLSDEFVRAASRVRWIQSLGAGVDRIIDLPSLASDVVITNARGIHRVPVSEAALALMFALSRDFKRCVRGQAERRWDPFSAVLLSGKTVGILGTGVIGEALASKCQALGMTVVGLSATPRDLAGFDRMIARDDLIRAVGEFDYFVLVTPLTDSTRQIVNAEVLKAMKPTAFLINIGRGALVDEPALIAALQQKEIAGAGLDCFLREPPLPDNPLWSLDNVVMTPHMAGRHDGYMDDALDIFEINLRHYLAGETADMVNLISRQQAAG